MLSLIRLQDKKDLSDGTNLSIGSQPSIELNIR